MKNIVSLFIVSFFICNANSQTYQWQKLQTESYKGKQDDIYFVTENTGWYVNGYGRIYRTDDGGKTWNKQLEKKGTYFRCIAFMDSLTGFAGNLGTDYFPNVTDTIPLYKTTDGGKTWTPVNYAGNYVKGLCAIDIVKEKFINAGEIGYKYHIYATGRVGSPAGLLVSHDNGNSFTSIEMSVNTQMLFDIKMFNINEGVACGASSSNLDSTYAQMLYTKDGGKTWKITYQSTGLSTTTWKCFFPERKTGYSTIQSYSLDSTVSQQHFIKTTNGGKSWKLKKLCNDYQARPFGLGFIDARTGFVGTKTGMYETHDGGKHWVKANAFKMCNKIRVMHIQFKGSVCYGIGVDVLKLEIFDSNF